MDFRSWNPRPFFVIRDHVFWGLLWFVTMNTAVSMASTFSLAPEELFFAFDEKVTVASRFEESVRDAPGTVVVITRKMIRERGYRDLVDLLGDLPGFDLQERIGGQDGGTYVIPRGIWGNNKIQVLLNGIPLNPMNGTHVVFGHQFSLWHLKQVEILYGPASAIYGADAFSGVINLVTEDPRKDAPLLESAAYVGDHDTFEGYTLFSQGSADIGGIRLYAHGFRTNDYNFRDEYKNKRIDNGRGVKTPIYALDKPYESPEQDYEIYFDGSLGDWRIFGEYMSTRQPNNIQTSYYSGRSQLEKDKAELRTFSVALENNLSLTANMRLKSIINYQYYELDPTSDYGRYDFDNYIYERSKGVEWREHLAWCPSQSTDIGLGFSVKRISTFPYINSRTPFDEGDEYDQFPVKAVYIPGLGLRDVPPILEKDYWMYGLYAQASHKLSSSLRGILGLRYDWDTFNHDKTLNPRLGLIFRPCDTTTIKFLFGTAFISPSAYYKYKEWLGTRYVHLPPSVVEEELKPEKISVYEINCLRKFSNFNLNVSTFYSKARDIIQEAGGRIGNVILYDDKVQTLGTAYAEYPINSGTQHTFGVDVMLHGELSKNLTYRLWYSFLNARTKLQGDEYDVPKVSTHKVGMGITFRPLDKVCLDLRSKWWSGIHTQPGNPLYKGGKIKGDLIIDLHFSYSLPMDGAEFIVDARNLLNVDYYTAGAQGEDHRFGGSLPLIPQRPRELYVGLLYRY